MLKLPIIGDAPVDEVYEILVRDSATGVVKKGGEEIVKSLVYLLPQPLLCPAVTLSPTWGNGPNKIFSYCPEVFVGIGTNAPRVSLDVQGGTTYTRRIALGDADPTNMYGFFHLKTNGSGTLASPVLLIENLNSKLLQLDNKGLLRTRDVVVDIQSWPDFVFEPNV